MTIFRGFKVQFERENLTETAMLWPYVWLGLSTILFLGGMLFTWWLDRRLKVSVPVPITPPDPDGPLISVIVPVRNEARNIRRCVEQLFAQTHPRLEIIVVNDNSTDETLEILDELAACDTRLRVLHCPPLPPGWIGKPHALIQGAREARGDWMCFMDADTFACPELLASTLAEAKTRNSDLLSILTMQELGSFWEKVVTPVAFGACALIYNPERINDPAQADAMAIGQFILVRRAAYEAVGGHHSLRQSILEDRALAETIKRSGYRIRLADGRALARTRMHTTLGEIWESWVKTIYPGMRDQPEALFVLAAAVITSALIIPFWPVTALFWLGLGGRLPAALALIEAGLFWMYFLRTRAAAAQSHEISGRYALMVPLGMALFGAMMLDSAYKVLSGRGLTWKGRTYLIE